jgi:hypothetical protein
VAKTPPTPLQITMQELGEKLASMKVACGHVGAPCVEIPMDEISVFTDKDGVMHAIMTMQNLIYMVDRVLRQ